MSDSIRYVVWRQLVGRPWEMIGSPVVLVSAKRDAADRQARAKAIGSGYSYYWFPEGTDPND